MRYYSLEAAILLFIVFVHSRTLYQQDKKGWIDIIRTSGNKRLYNVENNNENEDDNEDIKLNISYVRVSSRGQKNDLEIQKALMIEKYPNHIMIEDIGSGINLSKKGLRKIIKLAIAGKINEVNEVNKEKEVLVGEKN